MADRFWVGGTGTWDAATTTNWSATSGGAGGASVPTSSDTVTFDSNSGSSATVTIDGGGAASAITVNKSDLTLTHTTGSTVTGAVTLTTGTLNTNGATCAWGSFSSSNSNTRTLTLGSSAITLTGTGTAWSAATTTNLTVTANTATVTLTGASAIFNGPANWNGMSLVLSGSGGQQVNGGTFDDVTRTGTAAKSDSFHVWSGSFTCTGTFTVTGNSATNRVLVQSTVLGTARTITAATTSLTNVDFRDVTAAGAADWDGTSIGDCGGNTGITADPALDCYRVGAGGNWSDAAWFTTSGGATPARVPLPQDTAYIDANASGTITNDMPRIGGDIDFTGFAGTFAVTTAPEVYGSMTLGSGMTVSGTGGVTFMGRSSHTIVSSGKTWTGAVGINCVTGSYTLSDAFATSYATTFALVVTSGTFSDGGFATSLTGSAARFLMSAGTVTLSGTTTIASTSSAIPWQVSGGTLNHTGTIALTGATSTARTFAGGSKVYGTLTDTNTSTGQLSITGTNTFGTLTVTATQARTLTLPAGVTTTVTGNLYLNGAPGQLLTVNAA